MTEKNCENCNPKRTKSSCGVCSKLSNWQPTPPQIDSLREKIQKILRKTLCDPKECDTDNHCKNCYATSEIIKAFVERKA